MASENETRNDNKIYQEREQNMTNKKESILITADTILFFDMDGTLVETNLANFLSYEKAIHSVIKTEKKLIYNPDIRFNRSYLKNAIPNLTKTEYKEIIQKKEKYYKDFLPETTLISKNTEIFFKYSETNMTVLVTNCRKDRVLTTLNYYGLTERFSNIFWREFADNEKKKNKFKNAITLLGVPPNIIVAFEDEESEINDALKAGIKIINPKILLE
jgi:beta-phosphoglucomutase